MAQRRWRFLWRVFGAGDAPNQRFRATLMRFWKEFLNLIMISIERLASVGRNRNHQPQPTHVPRPRLSAVETIELATYRSSL
jgi:hypothetical protein